ncbi:hypothetical protein BMG523Draft_01235 [Frankia sp. BMG5.23]|nr:hypothetical protein BMG523Draft_01235 [Frankia sp. BMG5.23]
MTSWAQVTPGAREHCHEYVHEYVHEHSEGARWLCCR